MRHAFGHAPVREEIERPDGCAHGRRLPLGLADDHAMPQLHLMPLDGLELEARRVHQHIAVVQFLRQQIPETLLIDPELRQADLRRNVQGLQRRPVHPAGDPQAVVFLEAPHRAVQAFGVVDAEQGLAGPGAPLAAGSEAPVEKPDALIVVLRPDRPRAGNGGPAAVRDDLLIALDRAVQRLDHLLAAQRHLVGAQIVESIGAAAIVIGRGLRLLGVLETGKILPPLASCANAGEASAATVSAAERQKVRRDRIDQIRPVTPSPASKDHACLLFQGSPLRCQNPTVPLA